MAADNNAAKCRVLTTSMGLIRWVLLRPIRPQHTSLPVVTLDESTSAWLIFKAHNPRPLCLWRRRDAANSPKLYLPTEATRGSMYAIAVSAALLVLTGVVLWVVVWFRSVLSHQ